jgi:hypothetical protein
MHMGGIRRTVLASVLCLGVLPSGHALAQQPADTAGSAADQIANFFSKVGDQIYEDCIFELSEEQVEVQYALIEAYVKQGASSSVARRLAVTQIRPPKLSQECEQIQRLPRPPPPSAADIPSPEPSAVPSPVKKPTIEARSKPPPKAIDPAVALKDKKTLPQWDCDPNVDYVTIKRKGFERKLTGGEICKPFEDVVVKVPDSPRRFRLGYTIRTGRLFVVAEDSKGNGRTIAWAISGREVCRNNPDPDCLATRSVGPLPPGEYSFAAEADRRISWGPITKRNVAGIYLRKLWHRDRFSPEHTAAILARGNIAIHRRLKGEMSEACLGLEPKGWAYVASLIKEGRATGVDVYIDEPHPQIAEAPPVITASSFSLTSLFK